MWGATSSRPQKAITGNNTRAGCVWASGKCSGNIFTLPRRIWFSYILMSIIIASLQNPGRISWQRANNETDTELRWHGGECLWQVQGRNPSPSWQRTWTQAISVPFRGISQKYPQEYKGFRQNIDREKILLKPKLFQRAIYYRPGGESGQIWPKKCKRRPKQ